jgi:hypothetical protein
VSTMTNYFSKVVISDRNSVQNVWFCDRQQEWRWCLIWEDGSPHGTHMHSGIAPDQDKARADIAATILWIEDKWPTEEYFQGA